MSSMGDWESREPGYKRKKLAGYWKAANELRQTYQQNYKQSWANRGYQNDGPDDMPGAYPGVSMTRSGDEQLVLFPSYARRHEKRRPSTLSGLSQYQSTYGRDVARTTGIEESEFWRQDLDDDNAIVDVDVRGWIYAPHRGPMNRKNRLMMSLARQLSGIPAPRNSPSPSTAGSRPESPFGFKDRIESANSKQEEELAIREAESIVKRGEAEAEVADLGGYSERPSNGRGYSGANDSGPSSREGSPERYRDDFARKRRHEIYNNSSDIRRRSQALNPANMTQAELSLANANLMDRIAPFMANPLANTTISAFFYNNDASKMKSIDTDASGHFTIRAALEFIPSHVRILASDKLSATKEVKVTDPNGVSIISDIDDTIKHSAITSGAKEMFRNVFIRDFGELSVEGVRDWYGQLANLGCQFHYVSNSPWQLYPVLSAFFKSAGLPPGSFHLKQYSGMLQGIFEPVAERKKGTLDNLMKDFPDRRFLLIGDSGEADLEVYTDAVRDYPGRILGVFIRDITTSRKKSFFDPALGPLSDDLPSELPPRPKAKPRGLSHMPYVTPNAARESADIEEAISRSLADVGRPSDALERSLSRHSKSNSRSSPIRPPLPPRRPTEQPAQEEKLIDLSDDEEQAPQQQDTDDSKLPKNWLHPPPPPNKPRSLSSTRIESLPNKESTPSSVGKTPPPRPRKPSTSVHVQNNLPKAEPAPPLPPHPNHIDRESEDSKPIKPPRPLPPPARRTYGGAARQKLTDAYNRMPSPKAMVFGSRPSTPHSSPSQSRSSSVDPMVGSVHKLSLADGDHDEEGRKPPIPPRKPVGMTSQASNAEHDEQLAYGDDHSRRYGSVGSTYSAYTQPGPPGLNKKEEAWRRRWARAKETLDARGVMLRSWRVGEDVSKEALVLVESAMWEQQRGRKR